MTTSSNDRRRGSQPVASRQARDEWRGIYDCPAWCTTPLDEHQADDPGAPLHMGPEIRGLAVAQINRKPATVYLNHDGEMTAAELRQLADGALAAAEWLEAHQ